MRNRDRLKPLVRHFEIRTAVSVVLVASDKAGEYLFAHGGFSVYLRRPERRASYVEIAIVDGLATARPRLDALKQRLPGWQLSGPFALGTGAYMRGSAAKVMPAKQALAALVLAIDSLVVTVDWDL